MLSTTCSHGLLQIDALPEGMEAEVRRLYLQKRPRIKGRFVRKVSARPLRLPAPHLRGLRPRRLSHAQVESLFAHRRSSAACCAALAAPSPSPATHLPPRAATPATLRNAPCQSAATRVPSPTPRRLAHPLTWGPFLAGMACC